MKLKAFSQDKPLRHLMLHTVKRYAWLPLVMLLLTGVGFLGFEIIALQGSWKLNSITAKLDFYFTNYQVWKLFPYGVFLVSLIAAWVMFGFLFQKKSASVMLLTGVSRLQLFAVRYAFGLVSVLIPSLLCFSALLWLGGNNTNHGFPGGFDTAVLLLALGVTVFFAYTVATLAAVLCGRARDFLGVCAAFLFGAKGLLLAGGGLCATFLRGFPYSIRQTYDSGTALWNLLDRHYTLSADGIFGKVLDDYLVTNSPWTEERFLKPYMLPVIFMAVSALLLAALCGLCFRKRNAEFDGKPGSNPVLTVVCTVILSVSASGIALMLFGFGWALGVAFLGCTTLYLCFAGSFRKVWKGVCTAGCTVAGMALLALLLYADPLGYGKSTPDAEDVQSVQMTFKGDVLGTVNKGEKMHGALLHAIMVQTEDLPLLESEEDIAAALAVHELLAEDGETVYTVKYVLE